MRGHPPSRRGSLYQRLIIPLSAFVLVASLALVVWISRLYRQESMRRFERTAATNAGFMKEVRLPRSREMAEKLATLLGVGVGFRTPGEPFAGSSDHEWPDDLGELLESTAREVPATATVEGFDLAIAPLEDARHSLVLVRRTEGGLAGMGGWVLAPALLLTAACGCLAFILAHQIVRPLATLTDWLPNLNPEEEPAAPLPTALSERNDELGLLARALEQTHQRLRDEQRRRQQSERLATLGRIATSLAHEIRNPAAAIRMHADLLARSIDPPGAESVALIGEEVDRVTDLVNQWLFVARAAPPERKPHDLTELVRKVARRQKPALDHAGVRLTIEAEEPAMVRCDKLRIEQVVRNLIVNAVQAMPHGGDLRAGIAVAATRVVLTIRDSGPGFSEEALRRFGEPFFSEREGGMGIGLTLAREVIQAHDGTIEASNPPGGGAAVRVSLPRPTPASRPS